VIATNTPTSANRRPGDASVNTTPLVTIASCAPEGTTGMLLGGHLKTVSPAGVPTEGRAFKSTKTSSCVRSVQLVTQDTGATRARMGTSEIPVGGSGLLLHACSATAT
jgi:hypothetical protein